MLSVNRECIINKKYENSAYVNSVFDSCRSMASDLSEALVRAGREVAVAFPNPNFDYANADMGKSVIKQILNK